MGGGCYRDCPDLPGGDDDDGDDDEPDPTPTTGPTPTTDPVRLSAIARVVSYEDTSCAAIRASETGVSGTVFGFTVNPPAPKTQTGNTLVTWPGEESGGYTLTETPPDANYVATYPCVYKNGTYIGSGWSVIANPGDAIQWQVGYTYGTAWAQSQEGDVYASARIRSYIPVVTPRVFSLDGPGGTPGVIAYGSAYDFDAASASEGETMASSENWLVNATRTAVDYYAFFFNRFGAPETTDNALFSNLSAVTKPASRDTPYYISGNMQTSGVWSVGDGESIVFLVDGDVTIGGNIRIYGSGFVAFIVHGDIHVSSAVGRGSASGIPALEGIYIATTEDHNGTFHTGISAEASTARFVGKGMFIADAFSLQRDLESYGGNVQYAAELFQYNPRLLFSMPDAMMDMPVVWQEVAP